MPLFQAIANRLQQLGHPNNPSSGTAQPAQRPLFLRHHHSPPVESTLAQYGSSAESVNRKKQSNNLLIAGSKADPHLALFCLSRGADINARDPDGNTVLHKVALGGACRQAQGQTQGQTRSGEELATAYQLLNSVATDGNVIDLAAVNSDGETALHIAARTGQADVLLALVRVLQHRPAGGAHASSSKELDLSALSLEDAQGRTASDLASTERVSEALRTLADLALDHGAS